MTPEVPKPSEGFGFTEHEKLYDIVSDKRFRALIKDERTHIHELSEGANNYGDFMFVTASRPAGERPELVTFWGLGYHESRERWIVDEWFWYHANLFADTLQKTVSIEEAEALLQRRREAIAPDITPNTQTARGRLFEMLAELTDEDGAYTELEDLGDEGIEWLLGGDDE